MHAVLGDRRGRWIQRAHPSTQVPQRLRSYRVSVINLHPGIVLFCGFQGLRHIKRHGDRHKLLPNAVMKHARRLTSLIIDGRRYRKFPLTFCGFFKGGKNPGQ